MRVVLLVGSLLLTACVSQRTSSVRAEMIVPAAAARTEIARNEVFLMPTELQTPMPAYPDVESPPELVVICVEVVVSEEGDVAAVSPLPATATCEKHEAERHVPFKKAVLAAVAQWSFVAAAVCTYPASADECDSPSANIRAVPVKLAFMFEFTSKGGMRSVGKRSQ